MKKRKKMLLQSFKPQICLGLRKKLVLNTVCGKAF